MTPRHQLLEHLLRQGILADREIISDGNFHKFTDARTGKEYEYAISDDGTYRLEELG